jgi:hypothetical protein
MVSHSEVSQHFIKPQVTLSCSQKPATEPYADLEYSTQPLFHFFKINFNIILSSMSISQDKSVGIAMGWTAGVQFSAGARVSLYSAASRPALRPTQPPSQWVSRALSQEVKQLGHGADQSLPSSANIKNGGAIHPLPRMSLWRSA